MQPWKLARHFTGTQGELRLNHKQINPAEKRRRNKIFPLSVVSQWHSAPPLPLLPKFCFICSCSIFSSTVQTKAGPPQGGKGFLQEGQKESSGEVNNQKIRLVWVGRDLKPLQCCGLAWDHPQCSRHSLSLCQHPKLKFPEFQHSTSAIMQMKNPYFFYYFSLPSPLNSSRSPPHCLEPTNAEQNSGQNPLLFLGRS